MSSRLTLLDQNNKKIYGGGNVKQGLVPSGTKFYGMRLKTNLNRARNSAGPGNPYAGVRFEQFRPQSLSGCAKTFRDALGPGTSVIVAQPTPVEGFPYRGFMLCAPDYGDIGSVSPFRGITLLHSLSSGASDFVIYTTSSATTGTVTISGDGILTTTYDLATSLGSQPEGGGQTSWAWNTPASPVLTLGNSYNLTTTF